MKHLSQSLGYRQCAQWTQWWVFQSLYIGGSQTRATQQSNWKVVTETRRAMWKKQAHTCPHHDLDEGGSSMCQRGRKHLWNIHWVILPSLSINTQLHIIKYPDAFLKLSMIWIARERHLWLLWHTVHTVHNISLASSPPSTCSAARRLKTRKTADIWLFFTCKMAISWGQSIL